MKHILLLEDDAALCQGVALALQSETQQITCCATVAAALALVEKQAFDLAILDENLPDGSGLQVLSALRAQGAAPVIILTANDLETDVVTGLELGADDYITKPFSLAVLRARVNACLRRGTGAAGPLTIGDFCFDFAAMRITRQGQPVELSKTEQKLLRLLVENRGQTLPRELLLDRVWGNAAFVEENALSVTVKRLRDKLEPNPAKPRYIKTVYGLGYTWAVQA